MLGLVAALTTSDLRFAESLYVGLTINLQIAISFKGGLARVWLSALAATTLGVLNLLKTYPVPRFFGGFPESMLPQSHRAMARSARSQSSP